MPEAKLGFESALASYQTAKTTFDAVLGALQTYRTLNVDYYEFLRQLLDRRSGDRRDPARRDRQKRIAVAMGGAR